MPLSVWISFSAWHCWLGSGPQRWDHVTVQCTSPGRGGELVHVCGCVHECGEGGVSRRWTACRLFIYVAYCLTGDWCCVLHKPVASQVYLLQLTSARLTVLTLLIKVSATVWVYRGHRRTLFFPPGIISLFIMCVGMIWNNSFVGGCPWAEDGTPAPEHVTLYCTWRPSALTTGLHGQVLDDGTVTMVYVDVALM